MSLIYEAVRMGGIGQHSHCFFIPIPCLVVVNIFWQGFNVVQLGRG